MNIKPNDLQNLILLMNDAEYSIEYRIALTAHEKGITHKDFHSYISKIFYTACDDATVLKVANFLKDFEIGINLPIRSSHKYNRLLMKFPIKE